MASVTLNLPLPADSMLQALHHERQSFAAYGASFPHALALLEQTIHVLQTQPPQPMMPPPGAPSGGMPPPASAYYPPPPGHPNHDPHAPPGYPPHAPPGYPPHAPPGYPPHAPPGYPPHAPPGQPPPYGPGYPAPPIGVIGPTSTLPAAPPGQRTSFNANQVGTAMIPTLGAMTGTDLGKTTGKGRGGSLRWDVPMGNLPGQNMVTRLLGPGGSTLRGLQTLYNVRLFVRGKGSTKETPGAPKRARGAEDDELHVLVEVGTDGDVDGVVSALEDICKPVDAAGNDPIKQQQLALLEADRAARGTR